MKRYLSALALLAILLAGCKEINPTPDPEPTPEPPKPTLVAPTNLHVDTPDGIKAVLSWENEKDPDEPTAVPSGYILDKPLYNWPAWTAFVCPLSGIAFFLLIYMFFRMAMRHYRSTGS